MVSLFMKKLLESLIVPVVVAIIMLIGQFFLHPIIQEKITSKSELWLEKKEAFTDAINIVAKQFNSDLVETDKHIPTKDKPTLEEINNILSQLYMFSENDEIPKKFI